MGSSKDQSKPWDYPSPRTALLLDSSLGCDWLCWHDEWHWHGCFAWVSAGPFGKMSGHFSTQSSSWCSSLFLCSKCRHLAESPGLEYVVHTQIEWPRNTQCPAESSSTGPCAKSVLWKMTGSSLLPPRAWSLCLTADIWHFCCHLTDLSPSSTLTTVSYKLSLWLLKSLLCMIHPHFSSWH